MTNPLKQALLARERPLIGCWTMFASPLVAEAMAWTGYDLIVIDAEHSPLSPMDALHSMQAVAGTPCPPLLRLADDNPTTIKQMMDAGAKSLMIPMIDTADQARAIVQATRYAPEGKRGFAFMHRASRFGNDADYIANANADVLLIAQIETPAAVEALEEIWRSMALMRSLSARVIFPPPWEKSVRRPRMRCWGFWMIAFAAQGRLANPLVRSHQIPQWRDIC